MSLFICSTCHGFSDADDGCEEAPNGVDLICIGCAIAAEEDEPSTNETEGTLTP